MDQLLQIFTQLGVDQSIFYQFGVFIFIFFILKIILFDELLFVVETREARTTKLESLAKVKFDKADKLAAQYSEKIESFNEEAQNNLNQNKEKIEKEKASKIKMEETRLIENFEEKKSQLITEMTAQKEIVMKDATELSENLVQKLTT